MPLATAPDANESNGYVRFTGTAFLPGLSSGDVVTLDETAPIPTTRHLTTLHVAALRIDVSPSGQISGSCQPNKPFSGVGVCPASGRFDGSTDFGDGVLDDLSGGTTIVNVPSLSDEIPSDDAAMTEGSFTAYAIIHGTGTTQVMSQASSRHREGHA